MLRLAPHARDNKHPAIFFVLNHFVPSRTCTKLIFRDSLPTSHNLISSKQGFAWVQEKEDTDEKNASELEEIPHSGDKEPSKDLKYKSKVFLIIFEFQKIVLSCDIN